MAKNSREYWFDYLDIDNIIKNKSNNSQNYHVIDSASQNSEQALQRVSEAVELLRQETLAPAAVIPINLGTIENGIYKGLHWTSLVLKKSDGNIYAFYNDSLGKCMDYKLPKLRQILNNHNIPDERIKDFQVKQQDNGYDCGAWIIINSDSIARTGELPRNDINLVIELRKEHLNYTPKHSELEIKPTLEKNHSTKENLLNIKKHNSKIISSALDSSDEEDEYIVKNKDSDSTSSQNYNSTFLADLKKAEKILYPSSYFLMRTSNQLITLPKVKEQYNEIKDPITFKENRLGLEQQRNELALKNLRQENGEEIKSFIKTSEEENIQKLEDLEQYKDQRKELYTKFKATFPFIPLKLSPTFVEKYNQYFHKKENELEIQKYLLQVRDNLVKNESILDITQLCNFFRIKYLSEEQNLKKIRQKIDDDLGKLNKITLSGKPSYPEKVIGKWSKYFSCEYKKKNMELKSEIIEKLRKLAKGVDKPVTEGESKLCEILNIITVYADKQIKLLNKLDYILGKSLSNNSSSNDKIKEYLRLIDKKNYDQIKDDQKVIDETRIKLSNLALNNFTEVESLYRNLKSTKPYITDPDYLKEVSKQEFLVRVLTYRKINRDIAKSILVQIEDKERAVVPPGLNSTVDILHQGSMSHFIGEMSSYQHIGNHHTKTLAKFLNYFQKKNGSQYKSETTNISEREVEFESLYLVETMRNSSALLTNAMFFELATAKFQPFRSVGDPQIKETQKVVDRITKKFNKSANSKKVKEGTIENRYTEELETAKEDLKFLEDNKSKPVKKYDFSLIYEQMPMAMRDAVTAAIYLENSFKEHLNKRLYYDYRSNIENKGGAADVLAQRDNNILFDWLCYKAGLGGNELIYHGNCILHDYHINIVKLTNERTQLGMSIFNKLDLKLDVCSTSKLYRWIVTEITENKEIYIEKNGFEFLLNKEGENYIIDSVVRFPLKILNELTKNWYGREVFENDDRQCDLIIISLTSMMTENDRKQALHRKEEAVKKQSIEKQVQKPQASDKDNNDIVNSISNQLISQEEAQNSNLMARSNDVSSEESESSSSDYEGDYNLLGYINGKNYNYSESEDNTNSLELDETDLNSNSGSEVDTLGDYSI